ncbi:glycoside hydrolase family 65 protein [Nocardiopsis sp. YSL2]|uniref:glycoside hydrolase family 65 protein n=1 Tax=Nocardiopsis sp. YSL2 TaxID=2939492 RepID=UPI0026F42B5E|nr:glycosyl hydrolase family 65 protein [Nocardiopsis sp. YSL2]
MSRWRLEWDSRRPPTDDEGHREALCTLGNGRFATRGAAPEVADDGTHYPGTYVAGCYDRLASVVDGHEVDNEDLVNVPNWLPLTFRIGQGPWFGSGAAEMPAEEGDGALPAVSGPQWQRWELDVRRGVLTRELEVRDDRGQRTRLVQRRFVSMADPSLAALETTFAPLNWSGVLTVRSALDGRVANRGVERYRALRGDHLRPRGTGSDGDDVAWLHTETATSGIRLALASRTTCDKPADGAFTRDDDGAWIAHDLHGTVAQGEAVTFAKVVSVRTSRDPAIEEPLASAVRDVGRAADFDTLLSRHEAAWRRIWDTCAIGITDEETQRVLNLHLFHLVQTLSPHTADLDAGAPARGLHGEAYRGHVFWDELFIFPFLSMNFPETARALLRYRWRRLPAARAAAAEAGRPGAMFPWQSGSDGREQTQRIHLNPRSGHWLEDRSHRQRHVGIAIAHNVWQYYQYTGDREFLLGQGAELLLEIARFLAGLTEYDKALDRYVIRGVMGPDEYHDGYVGRAEPGLDDNAYTNVMTVWVLMRAMETLDLLPEPRRRELEETTGMAPHEIDLFADVSRKMRVPFHDGVISQFDGYGDLEELDWDRYRAAYGDIRRLDRILEAEGDTCNRYKASKQADVLMLFFVLAEQEVVDLLCRLGYPCETGILPATAEYYQERTSHGSTLSEVVHTWVLARTDLSSAWRFFRRALHSDIDDLHAGTTAEGIHLGAMSGTVDILTRCFSGLEAEAGALRLAPRLPAELDRLSFTFRYHGHWNVRVEVTPDRVRVEVPPSSAPPILVVAGGHESVVVPGSSCELSY